MTVNDSCRTFTNAGNALNVENFQTFFNWCDDLSEYFKINQNAEDCREIHTVILRESRTISIWKSRKLPKKLSSVHKRFIIPVRELQWFIIDLWSQLSCRGKDQCKREDFLSTTTWLGGCCIRWFTWKKIWYIYTIFEDEGINSQTRAVGSGANPSACFAWVYNKFMKKVKVTNTPRFAEG